ncbi:hypothetical protein [Thermococcus sp. JCM 11816]|uniref:hypothetical protein n=1 Tax=Thermococcus sp. (strain JCM 11816 / KS-1) TaxID=1295125 RepID=UPI000A924107
MTYKGIPAIFYGDEIGLRGSGEGMSAGRTPMSWDEEKWDFQILRQTMKLIELRRSLKSLQVGGSFRVIGGAGEKWFVYERKAGSERVLVGINCSWNDVETPPVPSNGSNEQIKIPPAFSSIIRVKDSMNVHIGSDLQE